jgi:putative tryptophan/tyrosine transport system permease protein
MMPPVLSLIDGALLQGLGLAAAVIGVCFAFRVLRYPDLTADGSFLVGAAVFVGSLRSGLGWPSAMALAFVAGAATGCATAAFHLVFGVHRLLSGILTTMCAYSLAFRSMENRSNIGLFDVRTMFTTPGIRDVPWTSGGVFIHPYSVGISLTLIAVSAAGILVLLRSDLGLVLRAFGSNSGLLARLGYSPKATLIVGLAIANGLIAFAATIVSSRQGFVDLDMGTGLIVTLIAGLVLGEQLLRWLDRGQSSLVIGRVAAPIVGAVVYSALYLGILRASLAGALPFQVQPTDLKMLSAIVLALAVAVRLRQHNRSEDEVLPI